MKIDLAHDNLSLMRERRILLVWPVFWFSLESAGSICSPADMFCEYETMFWFDLLPFSHFQSILWCKNDGDPFKNRLDMNLHFFTDLSKFTKFLTGTHVSSDTNTFWSLELFLPLNRRGLDAGKTSEKVTAETWFDWLILRLRLLLNSSLVPYWLISPWNRSIKIHEV